MSLRGKILKLGRAQSLILCFLSKIWYSHPEEIHLKSPIDTRDPWAFSLEERAEVWPRVEVQVQWTKLKRPWDRFAGGHYEI